jgi:transposase
LTRIDGVDVTPALAVVSEVGPDLSKFPCVKHFTAWLGLCPGTKISGAKVLSAKTQRCVNRAAQALRLAAAALRSSKSALGAYFRRMCSHMDKPKAVTAAEHKLARLICTMLTKGQEYTDQGQDCYEERYRERVLRALIGPPRWACRGCPLHKQPEVLIAGQSLGRCFLRGRTTGP